jgi:hypothetical protein
MVALMVGTTVDKLAHRKVELKAAYSVVPRVAQRVDKSAAMKVA